MADDPGGPAEYLTVDRAVAHAAMPSETTGINVGTIVASAVFAKLFHKEVESRTAKLMRPLSPAEMREVRDHCYELVRKAMGRAYTQDEEAELRRIYASLGI